jgi:hypothetical protein
MDDYLVNYEGNQEFKTRLRTHDKNLSFWLVATCVLLGKSS